LLRRLAFQITSLTLVFIFGPAFAETCDEDLASSVEVFKSVATGDATVAESSEVTTFANIKDKPVDISLSSFELNRDKKLQVMDGFGGAFTESTTINLMKLSKAKRLEVLNMLFNRETGAGFDYLRLPIGSSDFSDPKKPHYTYDDTDGNRPDPSFKHFSMKRDEKTFELIRQAKEINPALQVVITPWSPPAWMKTPMNLNGGTLNEKYYSDFSHYLIRALVEIRKQGVPVDAMTIQNEPDYAADDYPSMYLSPAQQLVLIRDFLAPELRQQNISVRILLLDHNYNQVGNVEAMLKDPILRSSISGIAFHCYEGSYTQTEETARLFPELPMMQTECTPVLGSDIESFSWWLSSYVLGPTSLGSVGSLAWNLVLDQAGQPHSGGCPICKGLITTDFSGTEPVIIKNPEFYSLTQLSRFVHRGSRRIDLLERNTAGFQASAFSDNGKMSVVTYNSSTKPASFELKRSSCQSLHYTLKPQEAATFVWTEKVSDKPILVSSKGL
jgi:glucosylceramidase